MGRHLSLFVGDVESDVSVVSTRTPCVRGLDTGATLSDEFVVAVVVGFVVVMVDIGGVDVNDRCFVAFGIVSGGVWPSPGCG